MYILWDHTKWIMWLGHILRLDGKSITIETPHEKKTKRKASLVESELKDTYRINIELSDELLCDFMLNW